MRIVVVQTAFLGDVVLTTPLLRELRRARPEARISVVATPTGVETLRGLPWVDGLVAYDKRGAERGPAGLWRLARGLSRPRADFGIAAQRSARTGLLLQLARSRERVGFEGAPGAWAYTRRVPWVASEHAVRRYLELARPLGGDPDRADRRPELAVLGEARERVERILEEHGIGGEEPLLVVAPGSVWGTKRWTPEGYAEVVRAAAARGLRPILVGAERERPLCGTILEMAGGAGVSIAGRTSVPDLTALIARARGIVTNDSGPAHVASAVGTPVVAIFGPTVPAFGFVPWGEASRIVEHPSLPCRPCSPHGPEVCPLGHHRCMREIPKEQVIGALERVLETRAPAASS